MGEENRVCKPEIDSILTSVKKMLGILEDYEEFDSDIMMHINSAIIKLYQLGVGKVGFVVTSKVDTYEDLLGELTPLLQNVKTFLYFQTKLGFDPPTSSAVLETTKQMLQEIEWRITVQMDDILGRMEKE